MLFSKENMTKGEDLATSVFNNFFTNYPIKDFNDLHDNFRVDLRENDQNYVVTADLQGIERDAIDVDFKDNDLIISANRHNFSEDNDDNHTSSEGYYEDFRRVIHIDNVDDNNIDASYNDGVLIITLPKHPNTNMVNKRIHIH